MSAIESGYGETNENFKNTIGDILVDILEDSVDYNAEKSKETNTEQSDT